MQPKLLRWSFLKGVERCSSGYGALGSEADRVHRFLPDVAVEPYLQQALSAPGCKSVKKPMTALDVRIQGTRDDDVLRFTFHRALRVTMVLSCDDAGLRGLAVHTTSIVSFVLVMSCLPETMVFLSYK